MQSTIINVAYLVSSVLFILGLKGLTHPRTAVRGNRLGAVAMLIAVVVTLISKEIVDYQLIIAGLAVGGLIGAVLAKKVEMTSMPELVAAFNGFGGIASSLVAGAALLNAISGNGEQLANYQFTVSTVVSGLIGAVTFTGSFIAFGKLKGIISGNAVNFPGQKPLNALLGLASIGLCVYVVMEPSQIMSYWALLAVAGLLGVLLTIPIGGADMPVVIALLNSYSGLAASATGFVLNNNVLIIAGSLVGASGLILTQIMCVAMNRSLVNVLFGTMEAAEGGADGEEDIYTGRVTSSSPDEVAMLFDTASKVSIVPGYGLAVSQGQHAVRDLANLLEEKGVEVDFAIHPVAGRMPGHMNVLLAEADVSYDKLIEMEQANSEFEQTDVVLVIGANDVVNPVARTDPKSPIAGMPILDVDKARTVVVIKRSLSHGYAGIPNPLFAADNTLMLFGDGKKAILGLITALKEQ
ncbi:MAG: NAD(P)(+) transhydrogenase (Re/Si-specific) subunit beta [Myxococcota bacterium]|nr:NAD(P)(+) transhydrogenase (Re/Si-specific) subunit beta [Myxococcota bacterium]